MMQSTIAVEKSRRRDLAIVLIVGCVFVVGILLRIDLFNGTAYWRRPWHGPGVLRALCFLAIPLVPIAIALRDVGRVDSTRAVRVRLLLLTISSFALQILGMLSHPEGWSRLHAIIASPVATSYFTDATKIDDVLAWLANFHTAKLELHSAVHPPGPVLYYYAWLKLLGPDAGALAGGIAFGALAALGVPVLWAFGRLWTQQYVPRLLACVLYTLLPALIAFFPEFDQIYPVFCMLIAMSWARALQGSHAQAMILGLLLFVATMFAYNLLAIGAFIVLYAAYFLYREHWSVAALRLVGRAAGMSLAGFALLHAMLWATTSYNPILSFMHAYATQHQLAAQLDRPWSSCVVFDLYDFFIGSGVLALPLLSTFLLRTRAEFDWGRTDLALSVIGLATLLAVDVTGLLRAETARGWLFLQPFVIVPAALALSRFEPRERHVVLGLQWLIVVVLIGKLSFIDP